MAAVRDVVVRNERTGSEYILEAGKTLILWHKTLREKGLLDGSEQFPRDNFGILVNGGECLLRFPRDLAPGQVVCDGQVIMDPSLPHHLPVDSREVRLEVGGIVFVIVRRNVSGS